MTPKGHAISTGGGMEDIMLKRGGLIALTAAALMLAPAQTEAKNKTAKAIAIAIGATALAAGIASAANGDLDEDYYSYSYGHDQGTNAAAACVHKARRQLERMGGDELVVRDVDRLDPFPNRTWKVRLRVTRYGPWGRDRAVASCRVEYDRVVGFKWED
jgi:hypothetical protein